MAKKKIYEAETEVEAVEVDTKEKSASVKVLSNIRKGPSTETPVIKTVDAGEIITVTDENNGFYKVNSGNVVGYIRSDLIEIK